MAARKKNRAREAQLAFEALSIEGGLLSPEWLSRAAQLAAGGQSEADYRIPKGLNLRDEIGRFWRIAQAHWSDFVAGRTGQADTRLVAERFVLALLRESFGFASLGTAEPVVVAERSYPIGFAAIGDRVPLVIAPAGSGLDTLSLAFGDGSRRRSAFGLAQEYLNAADGAMWGLASDGLTLRIVRDNASLTRPAWIEADLQRIFTEERYADFAALWLLAHETRFGREGQAVSECALETWRNAGREEGTRAREHLRRGVEDALIALGQGFLAHSDNQALRGALGTGALSPQDYFNQLLRLVYRLIFLLTVEERGVLHPDGTDEKAKALYKAGYSLRRLSERSVKRSAHDRFVDLWEATKIVFRGVEVGEPRLGLPALAGIFSKAQCPALDSAKLQNRALLLAVSKLAWLREDGALARVNWRDMGPEELGSVYESLLELVPQITKDGRQFAFATGGETKGNARKTTGSYYTPDSLVQVLLDSALEPVVKDTIAKHPDNSVEALLGLSIVDPACGSGHFLLAAARRLASHVARLSANGTPSAAEYRHALRQVVGRCIYGVDLNPMAVELCKVSLWMEAVEPGLPLTFLNSHIQHGNALLGTTPELMAKGIPDAAWEPIEGDDKKTASALKKRNRKAVEGQRSLDTLWSKPSDAEAQAVARAVAELEAASDANPEALARKESQWDGILRSAEYRHQKFVADAWCAAFVWPKQPGEFADAAPTNEIWRQVRDGQGQPPALTTKTVAELAEQYRFFHWNLQFPQVFGKGGFDVLLGNPPWERVKIQEEEWFAARAPEIADARNAAARKKLIGALKAEQPKLLMEFQMEQRSAAGDAAVLTNSARFPLCGRGDVNTYSVFAELGSAVLSPSGMSGMVVPPGILTDDTNKVFARQLVDTGRLRSFLSFTNRGYTFRQVESTMSFSLLVVGAKGRDRFRVAGQLWSVDDLRDPARFYELGIADVALFNPNTRSLPVFRSARDMRIVRGIYERFPVLDSEEQSLNVWKVELGTMFHMASASTHFKSRSDLERDGWKLSGNRFVRGEETYLPLYESKLAHQFNHRHATFAALDDGEALFRRRARTGKPSEQELQSPGWLPIPRYWLPLEVVQSEVVRSQKWLLAYRRTINAVADSRSVVATILPLAGIGDSLFVIKGLRASDACVLTAMLNSFVFDYIARQKATGGNLSFYVLKQLPVVPPSAFDDEVRAFVVKRALELAVTADDMLPFAGECGYSGAPFRWDSGRRLLLRAELDALFLRLFGIPRDDAEYLLDFFDVVRRRDESESGEYRTKRVVLEIYDAMAEAARTGTTYQTRIEPPPADVRVAHPARGGKGIPLRPARPQPEVTLAAAPVNAVVPDLAAIGSDVWARPHTLARGEIQAAILAVLKAHSTPMDRRQARLAALLCLEPHLLVSQLDKAERANWGRVVGSDANKAANASIDGTTQEWGPALSGLRGRERLIEDLHQNTWTLGTGTDAIDTSGWPDGRAGFVVNVLRRLQTSTQVEAIILKLPTVARQWLHHAA